MNPQNRQDPGSGGSFDAAINTALLAKACFVAGTPILTPYGHQPIETLSIGDRVWARPQDQPDAPPRVQVVEKTFHRTSAIVRLHVAERLIETTDAHPFFVVGRGWTPAGELHVGDLIASHRGDPTAVTFLERDPREQPVYNVRVSEDHTYFVGAADWPFTLWAHNEGDCGKQQQGAVDATVGNVGTASTSPTYANFDEALRDAQDLREKIDELSKDPNVDQAKIDELADRYYNALRKAYWFHNQEKSEYEAWAARYSTFGAFVVQLVFMGQRDELDALPATVGRPGQGKDQAESLSVLSAAHAQDRLRAEDNARNEDGDSQRERANWVQQKENNDVVFLNALTASKITSLREEADEIKRQAWQRGDGLTVAGIYSAEVAGRVVLFIIVRKVAATGPAQFIARPIMSAGNGSVGAGLWVVGIGSATYGAVTEGFAAINADNGRGRIEHGLESLSHLAVAMEMAPHYPRPSDGPSIDFPLPAPQLQLVGVGAPTPVGAGTISIPTVIFDCDPKMLTGLTFMVGGENSPASLRGSQQGASELQGRAAELNALRRPWEASNGTTAAIKVQNKVTGEVKTLIATEGKTMPKEFAGKLAPGEEFIGEVGHAEQTILLNLGPDWVVIEGGASRNVCKITCQPLVEGRGMKLGGPEFRGASDKTRFRMFWRE